MISTCVLEGKTAFITFSGDLLHVQLSFLKLWIVSLCVSAIREDGMPGGRNKSIGPVQVNASITVCCSVPPLRCLFSSSCERRSRTHAAASVPFSDSDVDLELCRRELGRGALAAV